MAVQNKIEKYELIDEVLQHRSMTHDKLADYLTRLLRDRGVEDSISQPSVSRWLQKRDSECKEASKVILHKYIDVTLPADLKILDEIMQFCLVVFRDKLNNQVDELKESFKVLTDIITAKNLNIEKLNKLLDQNKEIIVQVEESLSIGLRDRFTALDHLHRIVQTKLKWIGIEGDEDERIGSLSDEDRQIYEEMAEEFAKIKINQNKVEEGESLSETGTGKA